MVLLGLITSTLFCIQSSFTPHGESVHGGISCSDIRRTLVRIVKKTGKHDWPQIPIPGNDLWTGICILTLEYFDRVCGSVSQSKDVYSVSSRHEDLQNRHTYSVSL